MPTIRHSATTPVVTLGVFLVATVVSILCLPGSIVYSAILTNMPDAPAPGYVQAGVPFMVRDGYATQICVSTHAGRPLLPFVTPSATFGAAARREPDHVHAGVPFTVQDGHGTQICISSRGGQPLPPLIGP